MIKIRCDKTMRDSLTSFIETMEFPAEITNDEQSNICVLTENDVSVIHNINSESIIIANGDNHDLVKSLCGCNNTVITCGLSQICTITLSSIEDDGFVVCIQRNINDINGRQIIPQEIPVKRVGAAEAYHAVLLYATALIGGEKPDKLILEGR